MTLATMRCAACSAELPEGASVCTHCGATVYPSERMTLLSELGDLHDMALLGETAAPEAAAGARRPRWAWMAAVAGLLLVGAGAIWGWQHQARPGVSAQALRDATEAAVRDGMGPGSEPVCVANGLAYDALPVHVEVDNEATTAWMDALVSAGLYAPATDAQAFTKDGAAVRDYLPLPALSGWGGSRRLCMARSVRLEAVRNLGAVEPMRVRGEAFTGVTADVVWVMVDPAPWLQSPGAAAALAAQWPAWRGARWQVGPEGWTLLQRRHFFLQDGRWYTAESLERRNDLPPRPPPPA